MLRYQISAVSPSPRLRIGREPAAELLEQAISDSRGDRGRQRPIRIKTPGPSVSTVSVGPRFHFDWETVLRYDSLDGRLLRVVSRRRSRRGSNASARARTGFASLADSPRRRRSRPPTPRSNRGRRDAHPPEPATGFRRRRLSDGLPTVFGNRRPAARCQRPGVDLRPGPRSRATGGDVG